MAVTYFDRLTESMLFLAENDNVIFLGQSVGCPGNALYRNLEGIDISRRIEMPVTEDMQMGMSIGMSLNGIIPVAIYSRFDFLVCASNQLINHLDKFPDMSNHRVVPKVIIRVCVGGTIPLNPGVQHCSNHYEGFSRLLKTVKIVTLDDPDEVFLSYVQALESEGSTMLVEKANLYSRECKV